VGSPRGRVHRQWVRFRGRHPLYLLSRLGTDHGRGTFLDAGDSALAITERTGVYAQARGEMLLHARNAAGSECDFTYTIYKPVTAKALPIFKQKVPRTPGAHGTSD